MYEKTSLTELSTYFVRKIYFLRIWGSCTGGVENLYHSILLSHSHTNSLHFVNRASFKPWPWRSTQTQKNLCVLTDHLLICHSDSLRCIGPSCISPTVDHYQREWRIMGAGASGGSPVPYFRPSYTIIPLSPCLQLTMLVLQLWPTITLPLIFV